MIQRAVRFVHKEPTIWGPISLLFTLAIAVKTAIPFDLLFIAAAGLFLSARWHMRGFCYSFVLLGVGAVARHAFVVTDHLWQLGIEGSMACAFFIIAVAFEQGASLIESLHSQMQTRKAAVENLEEEISKVQENAQSQQIAFQEKVATLQKELEDLQTEHSSMLILNEVLRKTTARHAADSETVHARNFELLRNIDGLKAEYEVLENQLLRLKNTDEMAIQNRQLMKELNAARYEKEQTHLINETLARLYARESLKAKDADSEAASIAIQLEAARKEAERIAAPLEERLAAAKSEINLLKFEFEKANLESNRAREQLLQLGEIQTERNFLRDRLEVAMEEISLLQQRPKEVVQDPLLVEQLQRAKETIEGLRQEITLLQQRPKEVVQDPLLVEQLQRAEKTIEGLSQEIVLLQQRPKEVVQDPLLVEQLQRAQETIEGLNQEIVLLQQRPKEVVQDPLLVKQLQRAQETIEGLNQEISLLQQRPKEVVQDPLLVEQLHRAQETIEGLRQEITLLQQKPKEIVEQLQRAEEKIGQLQKEMAQMKPDPRLNEELAYANEKIVKLAQIEPLFKQLKKQFEEKNQILHQVRSDLFKSDTELQRLKMEKDAQELSPMPLEVEKEVQDLSAQIVALEEENLQLQELITLLSDPSPKQKKK